jgi:hypothetical protein
MLVVQHGFLLELVWVATNDNTLAKRIARCYADERSVKLDDWVRGKDIEVKLREVIGLMAGVIVYAALVAFAIVGPVVAGCLISIKDGWALGLYRMFYSWVITSLAIIFPVIGLDWWDAGIVSLVRKTKERVLLRKVKSLSRVKVTRPCMQIFAKVFWRKMCSCSEKSNYTSDCCTVLESILADEVSGIRVVDICEILQEDSESPEPMRSSIRRELVRKLDAAVDRYLARQTAEKDAEEWHRQQAEDAEQREREAECRRERQMTTVREQRAAFMLGLDDPSDADMLALLERVSEPEELRKLRSHSKSCPSFRRTEDA